MRNIKQTDNILVNDVLDWVFPDSTQPSSLNEPVKEAKVTLSECHDLENINRIRRENESLREQKTCKICSDRTVEVTFLPCAHFACCFICSEKLKMCPICRGDLKMVIKTYIS